MKSLELFPPRLRLRRMDGRPSLVVLGFGVCQDVRLEVGGLSELLIAAVERADVGPVSGVDAHVRAQVEVQRKPFPTAFKGALRRERERVELKNTRRHAERRARPRRTHLEGLFPRVDQLVTFELGALHEGFAALGADVDARSVGVEMLPHGRVIPEHLCAALDTGRRNRQSSAVSKVETGELPRGQTAISGTVFSRP